MFLTLGLLMSGQAFAGAWNQRSGEGQVISTSYWSQANQIFDDDFEAVPLRGFSKTETRLYLEYGVTHWLTLVGSGAWQDIGFRDEDSQFDYQGLDDLEIGAQMQAFAKEGFVGSIRLSYVFDGQLDNQVVDVLGGDDQIEIRGLIGQSRETLLGDFFYDAQFALRTENFNRIDAYQAAFTTGYKPTQRWLAMVQTYANFSEKEAVDGFQVPDQVQLTSQISLARQFKPGRYVQLGAGRTILGRNIVQESSFFIGLWTEY